MVQQRQASVNLPEQASIRNWFADHLGIREERKEQVYKEISGSATLLDMSYWLQILFAAGIATLGLALNSPAVIIGAMLISPLMGPILAAGLALASGDLILGIRAIVGLALSSLVAISFAVLLVTVLPFKEITGEIAARTQPNTLDLMIALFSGAIGSLAICKESKGVVTSIPGVAIAVALMPPLSVFGFGVGIALTLNPAEGLRVARGGGLLFLTNLVAITFAAMIVFLSLHIDTEKVRDRIKEWAGEDRESAWLRSLLEKVHVSERFRKLGSLPGRLVMIAIPILIILIPLSESLEHLRTEIARQQNENRVRRTVTDLWQQSFGKLGSGEPRSYIDQLSISEQDGILSLFMRVFTSQPYTADERREYARMTAAKLDRPDESVALQLLEIPTTSAQLASRKKDEPIASPPPSLAQLHSSFLERIDASLKGLRLPQPASLVGYQMIIGDAGRLRVSLTYLSERDIESDAVLLIVEDVRLRLGMPEVEVTPERIPSAPGILGFAPGQSNLDSQAMRLLDTVGQQLRNARTIELEITTNRDKKERDEIIESRAQVITGYLASKWSIEPGRIKPQIGNESGRTITLRLKAASGL